MSSVFYYILSKWPWMLFGAIVGVVLSRYRKHLENKKAEKNEKAGQ